MNLRVKKGIIGVLISAILILIDQVTKLLAIKYLQGKSAVSIIDGVFQLQYLENQGAAFGILQGKRIFFVVMTIAVLIIIAYLYLFRIPFEKRYKFLDIICILFFAGAIGNFIDRLLRNFVVDFFYFVLIDFPIFNVADIYVTVAAFFMIVFGLFYYKDEDYELILPSKKKSK